MSIGRGSNKPLQKNEIWIINRIFNEKNSENTDAFFVVEIVPKDQGVEVRYLQKRAINSHFGCMSQL
jgi:hypothetical protein